MLEKNINTFLSDLTDYLGQKQTAVKFKVFCKDDNIKSVLNIDLSPFVYEVTPLMGEIAYAGKIVAKVIVEEENGTVTGLNYSAEFSDDYKNETIAADFAAGARCELLDFSYEIDGAEVEVTAVVGTDFFVTRTSENSFVEGGNFVFRLCEVDFGKVAGKIDESFSASFEIDIKENIAKVLSYKSSAVINSATINQDVLTAEGEILLNLVYLPVESKQIKNSLFSFPFTQELQVSTDGTANLTARVKTTKVHLVVTEDSTSTSVNAEMIVLLQGAICLTQSVNAVCDAYSLSNETTLTNSLVNSTICLGVSGNVVSVNGQTEIAQGASVDGVAGLNVLVSQAKCNEQSILIEGTVSGNLFFLNEENAVGQNFEIPFSVQQETPLSNIGCFAEVYGAVKQFVFGVQNGVVDIECDIAFCINLRQNISQTFVSDIVEGEPIVANTAAIEVCLASKGDSIWEVAKNLKMTTEDIMKLNPELTDPLDKDEKLIIYHQKTA